MFNYQEIADKLEVGKMYTMVKYNDFGFPYSLQFKLTKTEVKPYAQYRDSLVIYFIEKGKRKERGIRVHGDTNRFAIWEGLVNPNTYIFNAPTPGSVPGVTVQRSFGMSFSPEYMDRALASVPQSPMILVDNNKFDFIKDIK